MKTINLATIFFCLLIHLSVFQLFAQEDRRVKLLDSKKILLNGEQVLISDLDPAFQKEVKANIASTCQRNLEMALYAMKEQPKKAYYMLNEAIKLDSAFIPAYAGLVKLFDGMGQTEKTIDIIDRALIYKEDKDLLLAKAILLQKIDQEKEALALVDNMVTSNQNKPEAAYLQGYIYYEQEKF